MRESSTATFPKYIIYSWLTLSQACKGKSRFPTCISSPKHSAHTCSWDIMNMLEVLPESSRVLLPGNGINNFVALQPLSQEQFFLHYPYTKFTSKTYFSGSWIPRYFQPGHKHLLLFALLLYQCKQLFSFLMPATLPCPHREMLPALGQRQFH